MQRKIVLLTFVFSTLTFWNGYSAEGGGMPQLNPEFWISQIFWLTISFGILFVILSKFILPKIRNNIELRRCVGSTWFAQNFRSTLPNDYGVHMLNTTSIASST